jgi:type II secretory pathway pseudopilin PulG
MNKAFQGRQSGFTLIEIMLTFCILILIIGIGALSLSSQSSKKKITEPALELTSLARQGMQMAITNRRPFVLAINENSVSLQNFSRKSNSFGSFSFNDDIDEGSGKIQSFELPEGMRFMVRGWEDKYFRIPGEVRDDGEETYFWVFESSGICEPIGVKLISEVEGYEGMITMDFNPLTAQTQETLTKTTVLGAENIDELE